LCRCWYFGNIVKYVIRILRRSGYVAGFAEGGFLRM
jgi:hypothetical protein